MDPPATTLRRARRTAALLLAAAGAVAGCGGGGGAPAPTATSAGARPSRPVLQAPAPRLRPAACPALRGFDCSRLRVSLHRRGPRAGDPRHLTLAVAVQRVARAPHGDLVLLTGGPGQPGRPFAPRMAQRLGTARAGYRLVMLDQRGTGAGALRCPELQVAAGTSDLAVAPRAAVAACGRALGVRRDAFATADTVDDLEVLRVALGARRLVLGGVSYGTLVAERYALAHPDRVRGLVLDSVIPQEGAELLERVPLRATARVLRAVCAARTRPCRSDPAADLAAVVARRPALGPPILDALTELSVGVPRLGRVPALLHAALAGDTAPLRRLLAAVRREEAAPAGVLSQGLHAATLCADSPAPWGSPAATPAQRARALARVRATLARAQTAPFPPSTALGQGLLQTCRW
ncbi:alpha/beta fold hydrolase [Baekduia soli]|uniref:prolyl aminopeptidase n=1 Tax=Baekduia soli TaxID=496014 RepID=A0A5B8U5I7_9ACTN|nr:alpha/beta hydrolase [Baekduia soli]QEC48145.1 alpha/beta fold hydrolase [Baekduia soli]